MQPDKTTEAAASYRTAQRPGQPGDATEGQNGPSPLSPHPTGPHAPYEPGDPAGLAAGKHLKSDTEPTERRDEQRPAKTPTRTIPLSVGKA